MTMNSFGGSATPNNGPNIFFVGGNGTILEQTIMDQFADALVKAVIQGVATSVGNLAMQVTPYLLANATVYSFKAAEFTYNNATVAIGYCYKAACEAYENYSKSAELPALEYSEITAMLGDTTTFAEVIQ